MRITRRAKNNIWHRQSLVGFIKEKAMAPHSSTVARKIPWMEEPGRLQSMGSLRVRHNWATSLSLSTFMHWRRKWQPTPVFLPGESHGRRSLVGCSPWGRRVGHHWRDLAAAAEFIKSFLYFTRFSKDTMATHAVKALPSHFSATLLLPSLLYCLSSSTHCDYLRSPLQT